VSFFNPQKYTIYRISSSSFHSSVFIAKKRILPKNSNTPTQAVLFVVKQNKLFSIIHAEIRVAKARNNSIPYANRYNYDNYE